MNFKSGVWVVLVGLAVASCAPEEIENSTQNESVRENTTSDSETSTSVNANEEADEASELSAFDLAAQAACRADGDDILNTLTDELVFASRGPDGIVSVACPIEDFNAVYQIDTTTIPVEDRSEFDLAVAEFMRIGLRPGDDRSGTGAYRMRDGRFCSVQNDLEAGRTLCEHALQISTQ